MNLDIITTFLDDFSTFWGNIGDFLKPILNVFKGDDAFEGSSDLFGSLDEGAGDSELFGSLGEDADDSELFGSLEEEAES